jgi:hypothetical protein
MRHSRLGRASLSFVLLATACGGNGEPQSASTSSRELDGGRLPGANPGGGSQGSGSPGGAGGSAAGPGEGASTDELPGFRFEEVRPTGRPNPSCVSAVNATAKFGRVHIAQTHFFEPSHPFFHLSADRDAIVRVTVTGTGASPSVSVRARRSGVDLGTFCLAGPTTLTASVNEDQLSAATSFMGTVPAAWVQPGLELTLAAGNATKVFTATDLKIGPSPTLTLITVDWLLFGDTEPTAVPPRPFDLNLHQKCLSRMFGMATFR